MKRLLVIIGLGLLIQAQTVQGAAAIKHPDTPADLDCIECHADQERVWFNGKHGLMGVKCIVCHGSTDQNFATKPTLAACRGCHADEVAQAGKAKGKTDKSCFPCHDRHSLTVKDGSAKPYHVKGGK